MSKEDKSEKLPDPSETVTYGRLDGMLGKIAGQMNEALRIRDDASKKQAEHNQAEMNKMAGLLQRIVDRFDGNVPQPQESKISSITGGIDKTPIIQQLLDKALNRWMGLEQSEVDQIAGVLAKGMVREVVLEGKRRARLGLKKGTIMPEEAAEIGVSVLESKIEQRLTGDHSPV